MDYHIGQILEKTIRKNGYSIVDVARLTRVNRKSVYNWFNKKYLKPEIIYRIGTVLEHDFSVEFPMFFSKSDFDRPLQTKEPDIDDPIFWEMPGHHVWQDRYISLLQKYNELLLDKLQSNSSYDLN